MNGLDFDPAAHRYQLDGRAVPGVTDALKVVSAGDYAMVDPDVLALKAALGQAVHKMIELDCTDDLDVDDLDPMLAPYYRAWRKFLITSGFRVLLSECKVASRRYGYAGQLDLFGDLNAIRCTIDAKCVVTVMPSTGPQTAAYTQALRETRPDLLPAGAPCRRYALQLRPTAADGTPMSTPWRLHPFTDDAADLRLFLACLTVTHHLRSKAR
jgi:hypothetical protein